MGGLPGPLFVPLVTSPLELRAAADACRDGAPIRPAVSVDVAASAAATADLRRLAPAGHGVLLRNPSRISPPPAVWHSAALHLVRTDIDVSCVVDVDTPALQAVRAAVAGLGARMAIRFTANHFLDPARTAAEVATAVSSLDGAENVDVVIETGDVDPVPAAEPIALTGMVSRLPDATRWRSITVLAADRSAPVQEGSTEHFVPSTAWATLQAITRSERRSVNSYLCFGTDVVSAWPRRVFPYTVAGGSWLFARHASPLELACAVVTHPHFCGAQFSRGDEWLQATASRRATDADEERVRWAAMNHHIALWTDAVSASARPGVMSQAAR